MTFVNEYAKQEDITKYGLKELWENQRIRTRGPFDSARTALTIDREENTFLLYICNMPDPEYDRQTTDESVWILHYQGENIEIKLHKNEETCKSYWSTPQSALMSWEFKSNSPTLLTNVKEILKETLTAYGPGGISVIKNNLEMSKNTIVKFNW